MDIYSLLSCTNMRKKCPSCNLSIGINRCRFAERVVETSNVSCPNAKYGCTQKFSYGKELAHEKECEFVLCYCPASNCDYTGVYQDLYSHYNANHKNVLNRIVCGSSHNACVSGDDILVLQEYRDHSLVVVQSFKTQQGVNVTVNCIAPCAPGVGKFSYEFAYSLGDYTMTFGSGEMKRIQKVSFQTPEEGFMSVPHYFMGDQLKGMDICIRRLEEEEDDDDDDDDEEDQDDDEEEE